jgi:predicted porin
MKPKQITLACMALLGAPAAAFAQQWPVTIYGTLNADVESVKAEGGQSTSYPSRTRVSSNSSNIGLRGTEDLGGGVKAFFQVESAVNFDNGTASGFWASRNSGIALQNDWGQLLIGQWDSPYKYSTMRVDPFGNTTIAAYSGIMGAVGNVTGGQGGANYSARASFDRRVSNVVQYWTPTWNGFTGRFAYGAGDTEIGSAATGVAEGLGLKPSLYAGAAIYESGPWYATIAVEQHKDFQALNTLLGAPASSGKDLAWKAGVQYAIPSTGFTVGLIGERLEYKADDISGLGSLERKVDNWYAVGKYTTGPHAFALSYGQKGTDKISGAGFSDLPDSKAQQVSARYGYTFSKRTQLYAMATRISNQSNAFQTFGLNAITPTTMFRDPARGADPTGFGIGMIHSF